MPREMASDRAEAIERRRFDDLLKRLTLHGMRSKGIALTGSDAALLARRCREMQREIEGQKLLAETMAVNPTLSSLRARGRAGQEV